MRENRNFLESIFKKTSFGKLLQAATRKTHLSLLFLSLPSFSTFLIFHFYSVAVPAVSSRRPLFSLLGRLTPEHELWFYHTTNVPCWSIYFLKKFFLKVTEEKKSNLFVWNTKNSLSFYTLEKSSLSFLSTDLTPYF